MRDPAEHSDWDRVRALFHAALDLAEPERASWVASQCGADAAMAQEVLGLLAAQGAQSDLLDSDGAALLRAIAPPDDDDTIAQRRIGSLLGPYRLLRLLGQGGMGQVFLAERADGQFEQQVALKLIRGDFDRAAVRERFLRERQILAGLRHPHIAFLLDGGIAPDGAPWFTLEYVDGTPLTRYCDEHALTLEARVRLLLAVCDAVQYAHRNLIVHRDLKPSNILVTADGTVKLLDFGIAKVLDATSEDTATQSRAMTREYAAPEQVLAQSITTATDVYALGVLLYELLTSRLPYARAEAGVVSWPKAIIDEPVQPLSRAVTRDTAHIVSAAEVARLRAVPLTALRLKLRGDLDRIVARALEKAPEARYPSVATFAADLESWLAGRALPGGSWPYRAAKFLRRNRVTVAFGAALALAAGAGVIGVLVQARQTAREADRALREAETTAAVKEFLLGLFSAVDPNETKGENLTARDLLDRGARRIDSQLGSQPALRAELEAVLGGVYHQLGFYREAQALQESAIASAGRERPLLAAESRRQLARTLLALDQNERASSLARQAHAELLAADAPADAIVRSLLTQANIAATQGHYAQESELARAAHAFARAAGLGPAILGNALAAEGLAAWHARDLPASVRHYRAALEAHSAAYGELDLRVANDRAYLTLALRNQNRYGEALAQLEQALAVRERLLGPRHPVVATSLQELGSMHYHLAQYDDAERRLRAAIALQRELLGANSAALPSSLNNLGIVLLDRGKLAEAERVFEQALAISAQSRGAEHPGHSTLVSNLAAVHAGQGKLELAERELRELLAWEEAHKVAIGAYELNRLGDVRRLRGDWQDAAHWHRRALDLSVRAYGEVSRRTGLSRYYLGRALAAGGDSATAEAELRASLASFSGLIAGADHPYAASTRIALAELLLERAPTRGEGVTLLREALAIREKYLDAGDPRIAEARAALRQARLQGGDAP